MQCHDHAAVCALWCFRTSLVLMHCYVFGLHRVLSVSATLLFADLICLVLVLHCAFFMVAE